MHIQLLDKQMTHTSNGVLSKGVYLKDGRCVLVKGNSKSLISDVIGYEPYSEVIASIIADMLEIPCVHYWLEPAENYPEINVHKIPYVSVCSILNKQNAVLLHMAEYLEMNFVQKADYIHTVEETMGIEYFNKMLLFDAFIGNEDRHLNNIDLWYCTDNTVVPAPLMDNGASLLSWHSSTCINNSKLYKGVDDCKPFFKYHRQQVTLVTEPCFTFFNVNMFYAEMLQKIQIILGVLPVRRQRAIRLYLKDRLKYLEWGMQ